MDTLKHTLLPPFMNRLGLFLTVSTLLIFPFTRVFAADLTPPELLKSEETNRQEILRSYLQLQEQIHGTQLAVEQGRKQAEAAAAENARVLAEKLASIEKSLSAQRARELEAMQSSNQVMLIVAGTFAATGLFAMLLMAYFQSKAVNRLADISAALPLLRSLSAPQIAFGAGEASVTALSPAEQSSLRLLDALERLEKRMHQLEQTTESSGTTAAEHPGVNGNGSSATAEVSLVDSFLSRGQALLEEGKAEEALKCFEEALQIEPENTEALVKKGSALEKQQKLNDAIKSYDRAIAVNNSLTIAYLYKAGLYNRMERFSEALACYEQALQTQEKKAA